MKWAGHVACGREEKCINTLVGKPEDQKPLGRPRSRWEDNIRMGLRENGLGERGLDSSGSGERTEWGPCELGNEPSVSI
jgi:hypothetical protein